MKKQLILYVTAMILLLFSGCSGSSNKTYPSKPIQLVVAASPGGGYGTTTHAIKRVLKKEKLIEQPTPIINKPGAGGEIGWKFLKQQKSNSLSVNSSLLLTNHLLGRSKLSWQDFTPLATLTTEWECVAVPKDSEINNARELTSKLKSAPASLKIAVATGLGNDDQFAFVKVMNLFNVNITRLDFHVFDSGGDVVSALLKHHVDLATMSVSEAKKQYKAGRIKILAVSSPKRLPEIKKVPTWKEEGADVVFTHWRGVMGPPHMTKKQINYWDQTFSKMVKTKRWKRLLKKYEWDSFYKDSYETKKFFQKQNRMYRNLIDNIGVPSS